MKNSSDLKRCRKCGKKIKLSDFPPEKRNKDGKGSWCRLCLNKYSAMRGREAYKNKETRDRISRNNFRRHREKPEQFILNRCRARSKKQGIKFNLTIEDIVIPQNCPLLGIEIALSQDYQGKGRALDSSPSLDRVEPDKGYTKGNVKVISFLANMMKNRATADQIKKLAGNIDDYLAG